MVPVIRQARQSSVEVEEGEGSRTFRMLDMVWRVRVEV
jgi:hypothetical protein